MQDEKSSLESFDDPFPLCASSADPFEVAESAVGRTLKGKWTLVRVLGVGGMATVYQARHRNGAKVAIKILHPEVGASTEHRARFAREACVSNAIGHPSVVRVIDEDVDEVESAPFLVMDLVEGRSLEDGGLPPFREAEILDVAEKILDCLVAAHAKGIIHRDLKPGNIILEPNGKIRVLDFGIAHLVEEKSRPLTRPGMSVGTPEFLSPEQARGGEMTPQTDLFALGATLFSLAAGTPLFSGETPQEIVIRVATERAPSLATRVRDLDPRVVDVIDRATRLAPIDRWRSAREMLDAVRALKGEFGASRLVGNHTDTLPAPRSSPITPIVPAGPIESRPPSPVVTTMRRRVVSIPRRFSVGTIAAVPVAIIGLFLFGSPAATVSAAGSGTELHVAAPSAVAPVLHPMPAAATTLAAGPAHAAPVIPGIASTLVHAIASAPAFAAHPHPAPKVPRHGNKHIDVGY